MRLFASAKKQFVTYKTETRVSPLLVPVKWKFKEICTFVVAYRLFAWYKLVIMTSQLTGQQPIDEEWLTPEQAAANLGMTKAALQDWRQKDIGPPHRKMGPGKTCQIRYPRHLLEAWKREQTLVQPHKNRAA